MTLFKVISKLEILQLFSYYSQQILNQISNDNHALHVKYVLQIPNVQKGRGAKDGAILPSHVHHSEPKLKIPFWIIVEKNQGLSYISYGH